MKPADGLLLISCYELGHQPLGLATPLAFLARAGFRADALDLGVERFDPRRVRGKWFIGISVPMHTALRLGVHAARHVREANPEAHICFYGLYASLNADYLLRHWADSVLGGEFEEALVDLVRELAMEPRPDTGTPAAAVTPERRAGVPIMARLNFPLPLRNTLPPLERYARLEKDGRRIIAGTVEASRGCLHRCLHCPIPPIYGGRFFVVPQAEVLEDIRRQVAAGARHITFADADFLNGPRHVMDLVRSMHRENPQITFDVTTKIEHILEHRECFRELAALGCVFVISAVESLSDRVLGQLEKGHTRADVEEALDILDSAGIPMRPSLLPFTPWSTLEDYLELIEFVEQRAMVHQVDPVHYSIRLLVPPGSALLSKPETQAWLGALDEAAFTYRWRHPDPRMDHLQARVSQLVEGATARREDVTITFGRIRLLAHEFARGLAAPPLHPSAACGMPPRSMTDPSRRAPRLSESWFC
ncbi:MAG: CUAEP/CCAEP-tail radical SAM protein [Acidobacteriota bacterium]